MTTWPCVSSSRFSARPIAPYRSATTAVVGVPRAASVVTGATGAAGAAGAAGSPPVGAFEGAGAGRAGVAGGAEERPAVRGEIAELAGRGRSRGRGRRLAGRRGLGHRGRGGRRRRRRGLGRRGHGLGRAGPELRRRCDGHRLALLLRSLQHHDAAHAQRDERHPRGDPQDPPAHRGLDRRHLVGRHLRLQARPRGRARRERQIRRMRRPRAHRRRQPRLLPRHRHPGRSGEGQRVRTRGYPGEGVCLADTRQPHHTRRPRRTPGASAWAGAS